MVSIAVIGTGYWGEKHVRVFHELLNDGVIDRLIVCDTDPSKSREFGEKYEIEYFSDPDLLIEKDHVDAVSIATPSKTHFTIAEKFLMKGKDVLIEKPMTMDLSDAEKLVELSDKTDSIIMVGHIFRYHPAVLKLKEMVEEGEFGDIRTLTGTRTAFSVPRRDMGVTYALGVHEFDLFCYLLNRDYPERINATAQYNIFSEIDDTVSITLDFGDTKGYIFESWQMPGDNRKRELILVGSKKSARIDFMTLDRLEIYDSRVITGDGDELVLEDGGREEISLEHREPLKEELKHFVDCVKERKEPRTNVKDGLRAVKIAGNVRSILENNKSPKY